MIYNAYSNKSPFKYYISILGGVGGLRPCLFTYFRGVVQNYEKPAYIILERSLREKAECIDIQIYDLQKAFDTLWLTDCMNDLYDTLE